MRKLHWALLYVGIGYLVYVIVMLSGVVANLQSQLNTLQLQISQEYRAPIEIKSPNIRLKEKSK